MDLNVLLIEMPPLNEKISLNVKMSFNSLAVLFHRNQCQQCTGAAFSFTQLACLPWTRPLDAVIASSILLVSCLGQVYCSSSSRSMV